MKIILKYLSIIILVIGIIIPQITNGQIPEKMSYQAVIRNSTSQLVANQQIGMQISILQGSAGGMAIYIETQDPTSNANGLISIQIGMGNIISGDFSTIDWSNGPYFIKTETDPEGGANYTITGTSELLSVPYAIYAKTAESLNGELPETDPVYTGSPAANITTTDIDKLNNLSGTNTGDQDLSGLATQGALEDTASDIRSAIPDVSGFITSEADPVYGASVANGITGTDITNWNNKLDAEIDSSVTNEIQTISRTGLTVTLNKQGGTFTDSVNVFSGDMQNQRITNLAPPMDSADATTKYYVDLLAKRINDLEFKVDSIAAWHKLVMWNKLGSVTEIQNSEIGENGNIIGSDYAFEPGQYGNGYVRIANGSNAVHFPDTILQGLKNQGSIELWINPKVNNPVAFSYGVFPLIGDVFGTNSHVYLAWGDITSGTGIYGGVNFDGTGHFTPSESSQFVATPGVPFHVAISWDVDGIDGTTNTIRIYRDGALIGTSDEVWDANDTSTNYDGFLLGKGPDSEGFDKYIVDNIKVWNYAKINFSDRFNE